MKLKILFLLNCESPKHIAKLFSLGIYQINCYHKYIDDLNEYACIIEFIKQVGVKIK